MNNLSGMPPTLTQLDQDGQPDKRLLLDGEKSSYSMGRSPDNDLVVNEAWISRRHAMLQQDAGGHWLLLDLGSANGTFVNNKRLTTPTVLQHNDLIGLGRTRFRFAHTVAEPGPHPALDCLDEEQTIAYVNQQTVTILVADIRGFTHLAETIGDAGTGDLLHSWSSRVNGLITTHHGTVDKFIGDAVMAVWHAPDNPQGGVRNALRAACAIHRFTGQLHTRLPFLPWPLTIGGAINTGPVLLGNMGGAGRQDFTAVGDTVNVTFRLEEMTGPTGQQLLLGAASVALWPRLATHCRPFQLAVKGKDAPVTAYGCSVAQVACCLSS